MQDINPADLAERLAGPGEFPALVDVREPWEFRIARIEGSVNIPLGALQQVVERYAPDRELVLICHHGPRSTHACLLLERAGYTRVFNLAGGVDAWSETVDPTVPRY